MLKTVVHEGTASRLRWRYCVYNLDVAGKTGTTQANADGWFMCFTPKLAIGSWVGADDPRIHFRTTELGQGSNTALPITGYFLKQVTDDVAFKEFSKAKFPMLPADLGEKLDCDLYEMDSTLWRQVELIAHQRDSLIQADTLAKPPETFLEMLYHRKLKIRQALHTRDSIDEVQRMEQIGG
jgi:penicillin-binding protein 1A